jgi:hypothetical protein
MDAWFKFDAEQLQRDLEKQENDPAYKLSKEAGITVGQAAVLLWNRDRQYARSFKGTKQYVG